MKFTINDVRKAKKMFKRFERVIQHDTARCEDLKHQYDSIVAVVSKMYDEDIEDLVDDAHSLHREFAKVGYSFQYCIYDIPKGGKLEAEYERLESLREKLATKTYNLCKDTSIMEHLTIDGQNRYNYKVKHSKFPVKMLDVMFAD